MSRVVYTSEFITIIDLENDSVANPYVLFTNQTKKPIYWSSKGEKASTLFDSVPAPTVKLVNDIIAHYQTNMTGYPEEHPASFKSKEKALKESRERTESSFIRCMYTMFNHPTYAEVSNRFEKEYHQPLEAVNPDKFNELVKELESFFSKRRHQP